MSFDNRIFNVNGIGHEDLKKVINVAFSLHGDKTNAVAWRFLPEKGLVLISYIHNTSKNYNLFPAPLNAEQVSSIVSDWLKSEQASKMEFKDWDADCDHDGDNELGWRVFVEDWGKIDNDQFAICAIRPSYIWYGK